MKPPGTGSAPPPDDIKPCNPGDESFEFNRLGSRLPVVLVSPWVQKGTVIHKPTRCSGDDDSSAEQEEEGAAVATARKRLFCAIYI